MADDVSGKIMNILNNPDMMKKLSDAIGGTQRNSPSVSSDDELVSSVKGIMNTLNRSDDRRINLLNAIRPYMRHSRASEIDKAIKMLRITKLAELFKNED